MYSRRWHRGSNLCPSDLKALRLVALSYVISDSVYINYYSASTPDIHIRRTRPHIHPQKTSPRIQLHWVTSQNIVVFCPLWSAFGNEQVVEFQDGVQEGNGGWIISLSKCAICAILRYLLPRRSFIMFSKSAKTIYYTNNP